MEVHLCATHGRKCNDHLVFIFILQRYLHLNLERQAVPGTGRIPLVPVKLCILYQVLQLLPEQWAHNILHNARAFSFLAVCYARLF